MRRGSGRTRSTPIVLMQALSVAAALLLPAFTASLTSSATAQSAPSTPQPASSCSGQAMAGPQPMLAGDFRELEVRASGLDPAAAFALFVEGSLVATGMTSGDGTVAVALVLRPLVAAVLDVQVTTAGRCAATTLTVIGPRRAPACVIITVAGDDGAGSTQVQTNCPRPDPLDGTETH